MFVGKGNCHHPFYPKEEERLRDLILERRANGEPCGGEFIRNKMNEYVTEANRANPDKAKFFKASHNWLTRYCQRMNLPNKKGPIAGTTSRKNPRTTPLPRDPALGRKKRVVPLKMYDHAPFPGMPGSSSSSAIAPIAVVAPHMAPGTSKPVSALQKLGHTSDDSSDDEADKLDSQHNIELLLIHQPFVSNSSSSSGGLSSSTAMISAPSAAPVAEVEEDALEACLHVIVSREAEVNAANAKKLAASKRGKPKRVLVNGAV